LAETGRFLAVGAMAFVVDLGLFNLLAFGPGHLMEHHQVKAKLLATILATVASWLGNRNWTFAEHRSQKPAREAIAYAAVNGLAALTAPAAVYVANYWLGTREQLAVNIATVLGIAVGTVMRYLGYKLWVFAPAKAQASAPDLHTSSAGHPLR
jgi:putative flippase GtrA